MNSLLSAIRFFTRIPIPSNVEHSEENLSKASKFLPLVGIMVGAFGALILYLCQLVMTFEMSILVSMVATILLTGAFHEDGFADTCDGFGGGWNKDQVLSIMKDSRIGTYGTIGLIMILLIKYHLLASLTPGKIYFSLIAAHALSRLAPVAMIYTSEYVRTDEQAKSRNITSKPTPVDLAIAIVFAIAPFYFIRWESFFISIIISVLVFIGLRWYSMKRIGGYTGDVLGSMQQLTEIIIYLVLVYVQDNI